MALWCIATASDLKIAVVLLSPPSRVSQTLASHNGISTHALHFLPGVGAEWSEGKLYNILVFLCALQTMGDLKKKISLKMDERKSEAFYEGGATSVQIHSSGEDIIYVTFNWVLSLVNAKYIFLNSDGF